MTMLAPYSRCTPRHAGCSAFHAQMVSDYRAARLADEERMDVLYGGCPEEYDEHRHEMITFKTYLIGMKGHGK